MTDERAAFRSEAGMKALAKAFLSFGLVVAGLVGLFLKIEYSGWVVFIGLLLA
jgi:hypothetical protein